MPHEAIADGATLIFVWGGDGTVQRCLDAAAGQDAMLAVLPAGTANLLATNLGIPSDLTDAVDIGLFGDPRRLDVGVLNDQRFGVMAGVGFDAHIMQIADGNLKKRYGQFAYVLAAVRATRKPARWMDIRVDGAAWFAGAASGVLLGQMGRLTSGLVAFPDAQPDDGLLEVAVIRAETTIQWLRVLGRLVIRQAARSSLIRTTRAGTVDITLDRATPYELDGGAKKPRKEFVATVDPGAVTVCVPNGATAGKRRARSTGDRWRAGGTGHRVDDASMPEVATLPAPVEQTGP